MVDGLNYTSEEIAELVQGDLFGNNCYIDSITIDSRELFLKNTCFIAIKGKKYNGADFAQIAAKKGAKLIVAQEKICTDVPVVYVKDTVKALGYLGRNRKQKVKVIGVTGSCGKTTVKDMIISILSEKYVTVGTYKNNNNEIGVALTLLGLSKEDFCVVEMGMRGVGQIDWLSSISSPEVSIITNCGSAHIGILGSEENIFKAKTEILRYTSKYAILPCEKRFEEINVKGVKKLFVGDNSSIFPRNLHYTNNGICFDMCNTKNIKINTIYEHDAINFGFAYAVGKIYGMSDAEIKNGIEGFGADEGRGNILKIGNFTVVNDTYNASLEGMKKSLKSFKRYCDVNGKRAIVLLGDMLEQGERAEVFHTEIGKFCNRIKIEKVFAYGSLASGYIKGYGSGTFIESFDEIPTILFENLENDCMLLVKASRALRFEKIIERMKMENGK